MFQVKVAYGNLITIIKCLYYRDQVTVCDFYLTVHWKTIYAIEPLSRYCQWGGDKGGFATFGESLLSEFHGCPLLAVRHVSMVMKFLIC